MIESAELVRYDLDSKIRQSLYQNKKPIEIIDRKFLQQLVLTMRLPVRLCQGDSATQTLNPFG